MIRVPFVLLLFLILTLAHFAQEKPPEERLYRVPDINGRATLLVKPNLPGDAMIANDGTTVTLKVFVDTDGNVISAKCSTTCPAAVRGPAETAAMASKFRPLIVSGQAAKYEGILIYTIAVERINWYGFGAALYSTYIFDNISLGPVAAMLTSEFGAEKIKLQELDNGVELSVRWQTIESVRDSIKAKLNARDAWWFAVGIGVRQVTAPFMSDRKLDRDELQKALSNLDKFTASPPPEIPKEVIDDLKAAASFKIDPEITNRELYLAISKMMSVIRPDRARLAK